MIKQLKNRWGDLGYYRRFVVGIDRSKMKLFNLEDGAQRNVQSENQNNEDKPTFDKSTFAQQWDVKPKKKNLFEVGELQ